MALSGFKIFYYARVILAIFALLLFLSPVVARELQPPKKKPHVVFLISEDPDNYEAHLTIPKFAKLLEDKHNFKASVLLGRGDLNSFEFPGLDIISEADLVVVFFRRIALEQSQLNLIKNYLKDGKPLVGIRTANHAFSVRGGEIPKGYAQWWEFVPEILGCENRGYGPAKLGTDVAIVPAAKKHPVLKGIRSAKWHSTGNVYHVAPTLDKEATVLLTGTVEEKTEPIAWTRRAGNSRIFYTSLGYPDDFDTPQFRKLLINGMKWAMSNDQPY